MKKIAAFARAVALLSFAMVCVRGVALTGQEQRMRIAAAADLRFAMPELVRAFESAQVGIRLEVVYGASGTLYAQIANGAPYDMFFSANREYAQRLADAGLTTGSVFQYARGQLMLCTRADSGFDIERLGIQAVASTDVKHIAIANPRHAPYGQAAEAALKRAGVYQRIQRKLVNAEDVSQAVQMVLSGNADIGFVSNALTHGPETSASLHAVVVPQNLYPHIDQAGVILRGAHADAAEFGRFVTTERGQAILNQYGFEPVK